jgi:hypothetical protein
MYAIKRKEKDYPFWIQKFLGKESMHLNMQEISA